MCDIVTDKTKPLSRVYSRLNRFSKILRRPRWLDERRLDFIIAGVQKGGTTALYSYLQEHPRICLSDRKEVHFFNNDNVFTKKAFKYSYYHSFFSSCQASAVVGEATPAYVWSRNAIERIYRYKPTLKLIIVLRDPVERAYSQWNMECQRGFEKRSFSKAIRTPSRVEDPVRSYVSRGFYAKQLKRLYSYFPRNQVLCLRQEELQSGPEAVLEAVTEHLRISRFRCVENKTVHARAYASPIAPEDVSYLRSLYESDVKELEALLGWDLSNWMADSPSLRSRTARGI